MDKTVKLRAYTEPTSGQTAVAQLDMELAARDEQLKEERQKSLDQLKTIGQLRESLKQEQAKTAALSKRVDELEAGLQQISASSAADLARKDEQLDASIQRVLDAENKCKTLETKLASMPDQSALLEARDKEVADLKARLQDMGGVLSKIISIAEAAKLNGKL